METYAMPMRERGVELRHRDERGSAPPSAEREAFSQLVTSCDRRMRMLAFRLLGDAQQMDDVLQEAYLKAYRAFPSFRNEASASTWLYRITYNACMDHLRKQGRIDSHAPLTSIDALAEDGFQPRSAENLEASVHARADLADALATLPPDHRAAVLLVDAFGHDYASAASIMRVAPGTVASRLSRARATLRTTLANGTKEGHR